MRTDFMPYCDGCPKMEPIVNRESFDDGYESVITCKGKKICERIENYIRNKVEKENDL